MLTAALGAPKDRVTCQVLEAGGDSESLGTQLQAPRHRRHQTAGARRTPPRPKTVEASYVVTKRDLSLTLTPKPQSLCGGGQIRTTTQPQRTALSKRRGRTRTRIRAHTKRRSLVIPNVNTMRTQRTWRPPCPLRRSAAGASWAVAAAAAARDLWSAAHIHTDPCGWDIPRDHRKVPRPRARDLAQQSQQVTEVMPALLVVQTLRHLGSMQDVSRTLRLQGSKFFLKHHFYAVKNMCWQILNGFID